MISIYPPNNPQFSDNIPKQLQQPYHYYEKDSFLFYTAPLLILGTAVALGSIYPNKLKNRLYSSPASSSLLMFFLPIFTIWAAKNISKSEALTSSKDDSSTYLGIASFKGGSTILIVVGIGLAITTLVVTSILISTIAISILNTFFLYFIKELLKTNI